MKKLMKKVLTLALALTVLVSIVPPMTAEAAISAPTEITMYRREKSTDYWSSTSFSVSGLKKSTKIYPKTFKSNKKSVATPSYFEKYAYSNNYTNYWYDGDGKLTNYDDPYKNGSENYTAYLGVTLKKAGTATVSYCIGNQDKPYKTKIKVVAYENPLKTVKITGVESGKNLASRLKSQAYANVKSSNKSNATVTLEANKNWVIQSVSMYNSNTGSNYNISNYSAKGLGKVNLNIGNLKKDVYGYLDIYMYNTKTKAGIWCYYYIND